MHKNIQGMFIESDYYRLYNGINEFVTLVSTTLENKKLFLRLRTFGGHSTFGVMNQL